MSNVHLLRNQVIVLRVESNIVLLDVLIQTLGTENLRDLDQLVIVVMPMEERLLAEDLKVQYRASISYNPYLGNL